MFIEVYQQNCTVFAMDTRTASKTQKINPLRTRSSSDYFLIGNSKTSIGGTKLPTLCQIFQYVLYLQELSPYPVKECIAHAVDQVLLFWLMAGIKTIGKQYAEEKLSKSWNEWIKLKKNRMGPSDAGGKWKFLTEKLDKLWDIASSDAVEVYEKSRFLTEEKKKEDIAFYEDQKHDRVSSMIGKDKVLHGQLLQQQIHQQRNTAALYTFDEMEVSSVELSEDESLSMAQRSNSASSSCTEFEDKDSQSAAPAP